MKRTTSSGILALHFLAGTTFGAGYQLYTEGSAEAVGQAAALSGRKNLTSLAWYNPSALAGSENPALMIGNTFVQISTDFNSPAGNSSMSENWRSIPHLYYVQPVSQDWTGALAVNAPYGLVTEWPANWAGAPLAIYSDLRTLFITPSAAYRVNGKLALSAGFNIVDAHAKLTRTGVVLKGDATGFGYTSSAHFQALEHWALGARYQSRVDVKLKGKINGTIDASADLVLPAAATLGIANTSIKKLSLGLDLVWTEWEYYNQLAINTGGGSTTAPKNWNNVWSIRAGGEYTLNENWAFRGGYVWDQSPVPDATRSPELPDSDRQMLTTGIGWKWNRIGIDAAYAYLWAKRSQMGSIYPLLGTFETTTHLISLSASYAF